MFGDILAVTQETGGLDEMRFLACADRSRRHRISLLRYHPLPEMLAPPARQQQNQAEAGKRRAENGKIEYFHSMLCAAVVAPGHNRVPLEPGFIVLRDSHDKQDCESRAVRRWLAAHGAQYDKLDPVYLRDDLMSRLPICRAVLDQG